MKKMLIVGLAMALAGGAFARDWQIKSGDTVAFLGDSITQMGTEKPWGYVNVVLKTLKDGGIDVKPVFAGVSGDSCRQMLARLEKDVLSKKPDWVIFSDGVNDPPNGGENKGVPLAEFKAKYTEIVEKILSMKEGK